jgi:hypothetical protein
LIYHSESRSAKCLIYISNKEEIMDKQSDHRKNAKPGRMIGIGIGLGAGVDEIRLYGAGEP